MHLHSSAAESILQYFIFAKLKYKYMTHCILKCISKYLVVIIIFYNTLQNAQYILFPSMHLKYYLNCMTFKILNITGENDVTVVLNPLLQLQ